MNDDPRDVEEPDEEDAPLPAEPATEEERALAQELVVLLQQGRKVEAVKRYREATGASLTEAVEFVNRILTKHRIAKPIGCGAALLLAIVAGVLWTFAA